MTYDISDLFRNFWERITSRNAVAAGEEDTQCFLDKEGHVWEQEGALFPAQRQNLTQPSSNRSRGGILPDQGDEKIS